MKPRLIIYDMDGTLVDSMPVLRQNGITIITKYFNIPDRIAISEYDRTVGRPFRQQLTEIFGLNDERVGPAANEYEMDHMAQAPTFPLGEHTQAVLEMNREAGIKTALVSSTHKVIVRAMEQVNALPLNYIFGFMAGLDKETQIAKACMYAGHLQSKEVIYVGDSDADETIARSMGIPFHHATVETMMPLMKGLHMTWRHTAGNTRQTEEPS